MKMRSKIFWLGFLGCCLGLAGGFAGHILTQQPKVWFHDESAGLMLTKGHYRSWSMSYCDGRTGIDSNWQPVSFILSNGVPVGLRYGYRWPTFHHVDIENMKALLIQPPKQSHGASPPPD